MISPHGILFDLDDTLVDRPRSTAHYARGFAERFRTRLAVSDIAQITEAFIAADGNGYRERSAMMCELRERLPWTSAPSEAELLADWRQYFPAASQPMHGLYPLFALLAARRIRLGVVTNGGTAGQQHKIDALGIRPSCTTIIISETVGIRKPAQGIYQLALSQLSLPPEVVWFVGDHPLNDVIAPSTCGMCGIWRQGNCPWPTEYPLPEIRISTLADLQQFIEKL